MIEFGCSHCGQRVRVADEYSGKRVRCSGCGQGTQVPRGNRRSAHEETAVIKFRCRDCNQKIGLPARYAGKQVKCAKCRQPIRVPDAKSKSAQEKPSKIKFSCSHCGQRFGVPHKHAGKRVKCTKCGQPISVPAPKQEPLQEPTAVVEAGTAEMPDQDQWANELLAMEAAAPEAEDDLKVKPREAGAAESQAAVLESEAVLSSSYDGRAGRSGGAGGAVFGVGGMPLAIGASFGGALLGAIIWAVIACVSGYEIGFVAWGVGVLAGVGLILFTEQRSVQLGVLAAVFALAGILMGKAFIAKWYLLPRLNRELRHVSPSGERIEGIVKDPEAMFMVACLELADKGEIDKDLVWEVVTAHNTGEVPEDKKEEIEAAEKRALKVLDEWPETRRRMAARRQFGKIVRKVSDLMTRSRAGLWIAFTATFSPHDVIWFLIALASAYGIGARKG